MFRSKFDVYRRVTGEGKISRKDPQVLVKDQEYNDDQVAEFPAWYLTDYLERV